MKNRLLYDKSMKFGTHLNILDAFTLFLTVLFFFNILYNKPSLDIGVPPI